METIEGNKLIAEFDGWYQKPEVNQGSDINWFHETYSTKITSVTTLPFRPSNFKYHSSWDWLMPVIRNIEQHGCIIEISFAIVASCRICVIGGKHEDVINIVNQDNDDGLESAWLSCVEFIQHYNTTTK